jgi:hypothetical protein
VAPVRGPEDADRRRFYKVEKLRSCTSRRSRTPAMTSAGRRRSSPPRRSAGRAAAIRCTRESVCCNAAELSSTYVSHVSLRILGRDRPRFTYRVRPIRFRADHEQRQ